MNVNVYMMILVQISFSLFISYSKHLGTIKKIISLMCHTHLCCFTIMIAFFITKCGDGMSPTYWPTHDFGILLGKSHAKIVVIGFI